MNAAKTGDTLRGLYRSERSLEVRRDILDALLTQGNAAALVEIARAEEDGAARREIVQRLSGMTSKEATDYLMELIK